MKFKVFRQVLSEPGLLEDEINTFISNKTVFYTETKLVNPNYGAGYSTNSCEIVVFIMYHVETDETTDETDKVDKVDDADNQE